MNGYQRNRDHDHLSTTTSLNSLLSCFFGCTGVYLKHGIFICIDILTDMLDYFDITRSQKGGRTHTDFASLTRLICARLARQRLSTKLTPSQLCQP